MSGQKKATVSAVVGEQDTKKRNDNYNKYVKKVTPKFSVLKNTIKAFLVGGIICTLGQILITYYTSLGAEEET
ncbi:MAG: SpoVA/SpoVAEb family sporulation membrane protein, partial [Mobilitalea sp.]